MYFFRADGNVNIGMGHLMRCLTIASALKEVQETEQNIVFLCADKQSAEEVRQRGFQARVFDTDYRNMESELPILKKIFCDKNFTSYSFLTDTNSKEFVEAGKGKRNNKQEMDTFLVDSYYVTDFYLQSLRKYGRVVLLDDMEQHTFPIDAVINYNLFADACKYKRLYQGTDTQKYLGSTYVPVRKQFLKRNYQVLPQVKHILITTGGGDKDNIAGAILKKLYQKEYHFHLIMGRFHPFVKELKEMEQTFVNLHIYHNVENMASLIEKCDLAITAGGTTIYELSAIGVPFICFSYAENQEALTKYIGEKNIAGYGGAYHKEPEQTLLEIDKLCQLYCENYKMRCECSLKEKDLIDGQGAKRIAVEVLNGKNIKEQNNSI